MADDNFKFDGNGRKISKRVENTVGKGEIAHYEQFLLYPQCFQKACFPGASKGVIVWEWVNLTGHFHPFDTPRLSILMDKPYIDRCKIKTHLFPQTRLIDLQLSFFFLLSQLFSKVFEIQMSTNEP